VLGQKANGEYETSFSGPTAKEMSSSSAVRFQIQQRNPGPQKLKGT